MSKSIPAPPLRVYQKNRLSPELRTMKPNKNKPVEVDTSTANALVTWGYKRDWTMVRRKIKGTDMHHVWRIK